MKIGYKKFWLGILVMVLLFGMTLVGCDEDYDEPLIASSFRGTFIYNNNNTNTTQTYIISANRVEYEVKTNGNKTTNTIYEEPSIRGQELWYKQNQNYSFLGTFGNNNNNFTAGTLGGGVVYTRR